MVSDEYRHHTVAEVEGYFDEALRIVGELEVDDELRAIAFAKAVDLLAAKQIFYAPNPTRERILGGPIVQ